MQICDWLMALKHMIQVSRNRAVSYSMRNSLETCILAVQTMRFMYDTVCIIQKFQDRHLLRALKEHVQSDPLVSRYSNPVVLNLGWGRES